MDVITQLQQYSSTIRAIDTRARQLNWFVLHTEPDPFAKYRWNPKQDEQQRERNQAIMQSKFQLPIGLPNMPETLDTLTDTYESVRSFATNILDLVSVAYESDTACLLRSCMLSSAPVLIFCAALKRN